MHIEGVRALATPSKWPQHETTRGTAKRPRTTATNGGKGNRHHQADTATTTSKGFKRQQHQTEAQRHLSPKEQGQSPPPPQGVRNNETLLMCAGVSFLHVHRKWIWHMVVCARLAMVGGGGRKMCVLVFDGGDAFFFPEKTSREFQRNVFRCPQVQHTLFWSFGQFGIQILWSRCFRQTWNSWYSVFVSLQFSRNGYDEQIVNVSLQCGWSSQSSNIWLMCECVTENARRSIVDTGMGKDFGPKRWNPYRVLWAMHVAFLSWAEDVEREAFVTHFQQNGNKTDEYVYALLDWDLQTLFFVSRKFRDTFFSAHDTFRILVCFLSLSFFFLDKCQFRLMFVWCFSKWHRRMETCSDRKLRTCFPQWDDHFFQKRHTEDRTWTLSRQHER